MIGELSGLGCAATWAIISTVLRILSERISPVVLSGLRCTFAAIVLLVLLVGLGRTENLLSLPLSEIAAIVASGILGQALGDAMFVKSMKSIGASRALPISGINPLLTLGLAVIILGERVTWIGGIGTIVVVGGVYLLAFPYNPFTQRALAPKGSDRSGLLLALAAAVCWSVSTIILKQGLANADLIAANLVRMTTASVLLMGLEASHSGGRVPVGLSRKSVVVIGAAGLLSALSSLMFLTSLYYAGAAKTAVLSSTAPLFGLPLSLFFLKERITRRSVVGTTLSVFGIWLVLWS